jgi:hypothetical protein
MKKSITIVASLALLVVWCYSPLSGQARIFGGTSLPVGPFAGTDSATGGFARPGISVGVEYITKFFFETEIGISGTLCWQPYDVAGAVRSQPNLPSGISVSADPWILFWPMLSLGYSYELSHLFTLYGRGHVGGFYGFYPAITSNDNGLIFTQDMSIDVAFSYGGGLGVIINKKYDIGVRFLAARPHYDVNVQGGGMSTNEKQLRSTAVIAITAAYVF